MVQQNVQKYSAELDVNGELRNVEFRAGDSLLFVLRRELSLTGAKPGCLNGDCGACTVVINHTPFKSCMMLAIEAVGQKITTIEGLHDTPIQKAFIDHFAFQCGYCTPGFIMNGYALLQNHPYPSDLMIKEWLESNICRCTSYQEIEAAIQSLIRDEEENNESSKPSKQNP